MLMTHVVSLAILQGLTEFLPISSSAHLILMPFMTGWVDQGLVFDVALHLGSLLAVLIYFYRDLRQMFWALWRSIRYRESGDDARLAWWLVWATIPVGLCGVLFKEFIQTGLRSPWIIVATTLIFGVLLGLSDLSRGQRRETAMGWQDALWVGLAQALALIPGVSRSGVTMTAGRFLGLSRPAASRFSFLLSIPVLVMASGLMFWDLLRAAQPVPWGAFGVGVGVSFISAYACVYFFLKWIARVGMWPFVVYRMALGLILLALLI